MSLKDKFRKIIGLEDKTQLEEYKILLKEVKNLNKENKCLKNILRLNKFYSDIALKLTHKMTYLTVLEEIN